MLKRRLYYAIPTALRPLVRKLYYLPQDLLNKNKDELIPPKGNIFVGSGDFKEQGERFLALFKEWTYLQPNHTVLDVGCGIGRMAVPLLDFLDKDGKYYGFDIVPEGIEWCQKNISSRNPNFHFDLSDIYNPLYNTKGKLKSSEFVFPYDDEQFDFIFLTSVFTHMMPEDIEWYLSEISRVLKVGGQCFITWFVLDEINKAQIERGDSQMPFTYEKGKYRLMSEKVETANVAYNWEYVKNQYKSNNIRLLEPIRFGWWSNRPNAFDFQDVLIGEKTTKLA